MMKKIDKNKTKGKSRKSYKRDGCNMESGSDIQRSSVQKSNDPSWYAANPALMRDAASLPFGFPVGNTIDWNAPGTNYIRVDSAMPGICTIRLVTGPGATHDETGNDAVNIAARKLYSWVRHANSGSSNYDPNDLMMYMLALDEAYMWYYNAVRAYGTMFAFNNRNRYFPKTMIQALGFDYEDLNANLAQFRYAINSFAIKINSLAIPKGFPLYDRHKWIYSNLYADGTSAKAQIYAFTPSGYRRFDDTADTGSTLKYYELELGMTVSQWIDIANNIVNDLLGSEDVGLMSGDILKAFKDSELIVLPTLAEVYSVVPVYDSEVLSQFQNATILRTINKDSLDLTQNNDIDKGLVKFEPTLTWNAGNSMISADRMLSLNLDNPSPEDVMVATRLMVIPEHPGSMSETPIKHCGTEIAVNAIIWGVKMDIEDGTTAMAVASTFEYEYRVNISSGSALADYALFAAQAMWQVADLAKFKFHPAMWLTINDATGAGTSGAPLKAGGNSALIWEVDNYTMINRNILNQLHETAVLSEFRSLGIANW